MIRRQNPDGTWTAVTDEEFIAEKGEEALRRFREPPTPRSEMTEDQKRFADKMQSQADLNAALRAAGYKSLEDLPHESDHYPACVDDTHRQGTKRSSKGGRGFGR